jgi:nucleoside-diphosphate-sugar epimerase
MRYLVLGAGLVGRELAGLLQAQGHTVAGTTTTAAKVDALRETFDDVHVLTGADREAIASALAGVDGVVVSAGPRAAYTEEERELVYRQALVETAESIVWAAGQAGMTGPVVSMSSNSVYGDAQNDRDVIVEDGPLTEATTASPRNFQLMERTYLDGLPTQACVLRLTEVYGDDETPIEDQLRGAHERMGGKLPFSGDALLYRTHASDVAAAAAHALEQRLVGVYNVASEQVPETNRERFDGVSAELGLPPFEYLGVIAAPTRPISVDRLASSGFRVSR